MTAQAKMQEALLSPPATGSDESLCPAHPYMVQELFNHKKQLRWIIKLLVTNLLGVVSTLALILLRSQGIF